MNSSNSSPISQDNHEIIAKKPFWKAIAEIGAKVPVEEWNKLPKDFARNFEHYMYGAPRDEDEFSTGRV
jgi:hypothetical protein